MSTLLLWLPMAIFIAFGASMRLRDRPLPKTQGQSMAYLEESPGPTPRATVIAGFSHLRGRQVGPTCGYVSGQPGRLVGMHILVG